MRLKEAGGYIEIHHSPGASSTDAFDVRRTALRKMPLMRSKRDRGLESQQDSHVF